MDLKNKHKIAYYYIAGAFTLLLALKLLSSDIFKDTVDFAITYLPFIIVIAIGISSWNKYKKSPNDEEIKYRIRKDALVDTFLLLLVTLIFYILYSPASFTPITEAGKKIGKIVSMETYFLFLSYLSVAIVFFSVSFLAFKAYQKTKGTYSGSISLLTKHTLYTLFFVFTFFFVSSIFTYPSAYSPLTNQVGQVLAGIFYPQGDERTLWERVSNSRISSLRVALSQTYDSLKNNLDTSASKISETITDTKASLDGAIERTNKDLKVNLSGDISDQFDTSGGTVEGDLTIEEELTVESTAYLQDVIPDTDDSYDLGSVSKGWDNVYIHALHGSSILTIGDGATSHGMSDTDDLLVAGDLEVNGNIYFDSQLDMNVNKIVNLKDPENAQDAVTLAYYQNNTPAGVFTSSGGVISPTTTTDDLNMLANPILRIGNNDTNFTSSGGLDLAGVLTSINTGAHRFGPIYLTNGAVTGVTSLGMSGAITASSGSAAHTIGSITITGDNIAGLPATPAGATSAVSKAYVDAQDSVTGYQNGSAVDLNMANTGLVLNIGNASTDFTSGGGLTLAGILSASSGSAHTLGSLTVTAGAITGITSLNTSVSSTELGYLDGVTSAIQTQFSNLGTMSAQNANAVSITGGSASGITQLTVDNVDINGNTISTTSGDLVINSSSNTSFNEENITNVGSIGLDSISADDSTISATFGSNDFNVDSNTLVVEGDDNQVGIGTASPGHLLDLYASAANPQLAISAAHATSYDPMLLFKSDATPAVKFAIGVDSDPDNDGTDDSNEDRLKIIPGDVTNTTTYPNGFASSSAWMMDNNGITYVNSLQSGAQSFPDDAGVTQWVDLNMTTAITSAGTVESYSAMLDGSAVMTVYGTADGSGGVTANSQAIGIMTSTPAATLHVVNNEGAGATNQGLLLHLDNTAFAGISSTPADNGGGLVITADAAAGTGFDFISAISSAGGTDDAEFRVRGDGNVYGDGAIYNAGADYAEFFYTKNNDLAAGELVCIDGLNSKAVKRCERANDPDLIGIISTKPAFVGNNIPGADSDLGETDKSYKLVGLIGQVPAKVTNENGKIQTGDSLTSASKPGYAMKANAGDSTVGVALENFDKESGTMTVLISRRNKSLTVEQVEEETTKRIAAMNIEDQVNALMASAKEEVLADAGSRDLKISELDSQVAGLSELTTTLQSQIVELQKITNQELNVAQIGANTDDIAFIKTLLGTDRAENVGDINILGKITAEELVVNGVSTGKITINIIDEDAPTIGEGEIVAITKDVKDEDGNETPDENGDGVPDGDGIDDETGTDGKSVDVSTKAVTENSKVFVTPKSTTSDPLAVTKVKDGESFRVEVANPVLENLKFDWWIVDIKDDN